MLDYNGRFRYCKYYRNRKNKKLQDDKQLTTFFKMMIRITNSRLNDKDLDKPINWMPLELNIEPELTDETDDE